MNKRYNELNNNIKKWFKDKSQDKLILQTLYAQCNLEHHTMLNGVQDLRGGTKFSNLSDEELVALFSKDPFNSYSQKDLNHLMQEVHNRYIGESNWDVTRMVYCKSNNPEDEGTFGYCCYADDLLFINKDMIDEAKSADRSQPINAETVGKYFLDTIWHETKHVIQYEDGIDLALGKKQDPVKAFSAAAMMVMMTNFSIADAKHDNAYLYDWRSKYRVHFCEHEANYAALKKSEDNTKPELKNNYDYQMYASDSAALALGFAPSTTDDAKNKAAIGNRVNRIESYLKKQIEYFEKGTKDCPIKQSVMAAINAYMKEDENGHSMFRDRMTKEVTEIVDTYVVNKRKMEVYDAQNERGFAKVRTRKNESKKLDREEFLNLVR